MSFCFDSETVGVRVIEVRGTDSQKVVNNLTTNEVAKLSPHSICETFITNVRGWVVAHGTVSVSDDRVLFVTQHDDLTLLCQHIDRYIIVEDAQVADITDATAVLAVQDANDIESAEFRQGTSDQIQLGHHCVTLVPTLMLGQQSALILIERPQQRDLLSELAGSYQLGSYDDFQRLRIEQMWPINGSEIHDKTLPQELDRDNAAISFTKGCYLGQETVARLDARGKLQRKLCLLRCDSTKAEPGMPISNGDGMEVGSVSSVCVDDESSLLLATLKRGNFADGTTLTCDNAPTRVIDANA